MFVLDVFYVALIDGEVVGIAACTDGSRPSVEPVAAELRSHLGLLKGTIAHRVFVHEFQKPPIETGERTASVEFVATRSAFHRQGVATALVEHILSLPQFDDYVLEVANTNDGALHLYEKAGFEEFKRIQEPRRRARSSGIDALVYMRYCTRGPLSPAGLADGIERTTRGRIN
jgi:ribosomal protein S18 acetylase RimI-like enzyme